MISYNFSTEGRNVQARYRYLLELYSGNDMVGRKDKDTQAFRTSAPREDVEISSASQANMLSI